MCGKSSSLGREFAIIASMKSWCHYNTTLSHYSAIMLIKMRFYTGDVSNIVENIVSLQLVAQADVG
jgi:hypothetical protein